MAKVLRVVGRALFSLYEFVAMLLGLGMLALLCLIWAPCALLLTLILPARAGRPVGRRVAMMSFRFYLRFLAIFCFCRFDLDALDELVAERGDQPLILVANHPSLLDAVIVLSRFPNMVCMMKAALMHNVLFGAAARLAGYICNDVALDSILRSREELQAGAQLLLFPEGTRTTNFPVNVCSGSVGLISSRTQVPIQVLLMEFSSPYLGKHWPLFRRPTLPLRVRVRVGRRFAPPRDAAAFARELEAYFRSELGGTATPVAAEAASVGNVLS